MTRASAESMRPKTAKRVLLRTGRNNRSRSPARESREVLRSVTESRFSRSGLQWGCFLVPSETAPGGRRPPFGFTVTRGKVFDRIATPQSSTTRKRPSLKPGSPPPDGDWPASTLPSNGGVMPAGTETEPVRIYSWSKNSTPGAEWGQTAAASALRSTAARCSPADRQD